MVAGSRRFGFFSVYFDGIVTTPGVLCHGWGVWGRDMVHNGEEDTIVQDAKRESRRAGHMYIQRAYTPLFPLPFLFTLVFILFLFFFSLENS